QISRFRTHLVVGKPEALVRLRNTCACRGFWRGIRAATLRVTFAPTASAFHHRVRWERLRDRRLSYEGPSSGARLAGKCFTGNIEAPARPLQLLDFLGQIIRPMRPTRPHCLIFLC